ncbi:unnamed protein product [Meganyctiphanes norvegica]|uniref:Uncharacterized protein n=1 Tax=Meganyctiphanes norvegica TaxID=48144 RepID=A0AAV2QTB5_MEGNR
MSLKLTSVHFRSFCEFLQSSFHLDNSLDETPRSSKHLDISLSSDCLFASVIYSEVICRIELFIISSILPIVPPVTPASSLLESIDISLNSDDSLDAIPCSCKHFVFLFSSVCLFAAEIESNDIIW